MLDIGVRLARTLEEQGVASLQFHLSRSCLDALATPGDSHQDQVIVAFERAAADGLPDESAAEVDKGDAQLVILVDLVHRTDVVVGSHQLVGLLQLEQLVDLTGVDQTVATHHELILAEHRRIMVEMADGYQVTALHVEEPCLAQRL